MTYRPGFSNYYVDGSKSGINGMILSVGMSMINHSRARCL